MNNTRERKKDRILNVSKEKGQVSAGPMGEEQDCVWFKQTRHGRTDQPSRPTSSEWKDVHKLRRTEIAAQVLRQTER